MSGEDLRSKTCAILELCYGALRRVDASDPLKPQTEETMELVSQAVDAIERISKQLGYILSPFRRT